MSPSPKRAGRASEQISTVLSKYLVRRRLGDSKRPRSVTVAEMAALQMVSTATSTPNMVGFSTTTVDHAAAETQYTGFKFWISESEDHYKPELAQLLYPLFTHLYIRLLVHCAPTVAGRFHKRHLATFLGNPEFKLFIQQLAEVSSPEEMDQSPTIASFRASKYNITLTDKTYQYLLRYLETSESGLLLQILSQEVELTIGDPLGAGSRQETRASFLAKGVETEACEANQREEEAKVRLEEAIKGVRDGVPCVPSIALYRVVCNEGLVASAQSDEGGGVLCLGGGDGALRLVDLQPLGPECRVLEVGASRVRLGWEDDGEPRGTSLTMMPGQVKTLRGHSGPVYGLAHIRDGPLISCSEDTSLRLWDRESGAGLAVLRGHQYPVWCVRGDPLGLQFVSGSFDRTLRLWRPEAAHPLRVYAGHEGSVDCLDWHPNCNYIFSGSTDKSVRMWSHLDGKCVRVFASHKGGVSALACSPDGKLLASGGEDRRIKVWDLAMGRAVRELRGHTDTITNLAWGADSRLLVSGGREGAVRAWDAAGAEGADVLAALDAGQGSQVVGLGWTDTNSVLVTAVDYSTDL